MKKGVATVAQLSGFDEIIDARSPAEFAEDRIPGAVNLPVLDNEQRIVVGTLYKQQSAFEARRLGGALVAENIARHLQDHLKDKPRNWRPLIYCWRGGQRSGAFTTWLRMVGWDAHQLQGGYKRFRHHVIEEIAHFAPALRWRVICGPTGSAKTRVLEALARAGAQTLDLEDLAAHKGSVLGALPDRPQPTQKHFETALWTRLRAFDPARPVHIEAESRKIGALFLPEPLIMAMRRSPCVAIEATREARLAFLVRDYAYLGDDIARLQSNIDRLAELQSRKTIAQWHALAETRALPELFGELIDLHYDPHYRRSQNGNYFAFGTAPRLETDDLGPAGIDVLARRILQTDPAQERAAAPVQGSTSVPG
ncbi:tRNA 2-selenouridine(34) synthase MnmH [Thauera linaloolentis]|uniref:tRNA 2-selenouridine synthase n=1 Tax=Thauera linaloolentis (strain DSM 12138 / JCM 21573 / CCUG 41526 / CIP 105981 / IAM 15112 / NBRC 102519 / 47Lol) TaxID=1123367 RepID=N6XYP6_THAL4|nr:tRNA 2-selenouridine(34) synthase MnmH [Thauera linaloolentis]ENO86911.1 tRNA 2-selenouridine synthase [Thauera linaloolentis 47Lol = DSM 12138]MCM8566654.1 tRNA 2-selenouridine(34) synthase MnmH [Thauera linaloolentis]